MDSFSSFMSSLDTVRGKSKKKSKSDDVKRFETFDEPRSKVCGSKMPTQEVSKDHNYNKKSDVIEMLNSFPCVDNKAAEELDAVFKSKTDSSGEDSSQAHESCNKFQTANNMLQATEKYRALLHREKVEQRQDRFVDFHQGSDRKRNLVNDEAFPVKKKLNVGCFF